MIVNVMIGEAYVGGAEGLVSKEYFSPGECADLADLLEGLNKPADHKNHDPVLRRLTDLLWALQNDTSAVVVYSED